MISLFEFTDFTKNIFFFDYINNRYVCNTYFLFDSFIS